MKVWIIQDGEPLPGIDAGTRDWRCGILAKALVSKGHEVLWWAATFDHITKRHRFTKSTTVAIMPNLEVRLLRAPGYQKNRSPKRIVHNRLMARSFAAEALMNPPPAIIFSSLPTPELAEQAVTYGKRRRVPVLVDVRDLWPEHYLTLAPPSLRGLMRLALTTEFRRTRWLLKNATGITSISQTFLDWGLLLAETSPRESDGVFPMSYPAPSLSQDQIACRKSQLAANYGLTSEALTITFVGAVNSIFDFQTVLQAAREFESKEKAVRFVFVGNGTSYSPVRAQARDLKNVIFTGQMDHLSVAAMLDLASVGLAPYAEGQSITGSLPNKAFEYMSVGLPLLSSHQGDLAELISNEELGLQYQSKDPKSLTEKIQWLLDNPAQRIAMGLRSRKVFEERFTSEMVYAQLVAHLEQVAAAAKANW